MRNAVISKTPTSARKPDCNEKTTDSGKKLVQARLPFKIISSSSPGASTTGSVDKTLDTEKSLQTKKRKLSDEEFVGENIKDKNVQAHNNKQCAGGSKNAEELIVPIVAVSKRTKIETQSDVIIIADDENNFDDNDVSDMKIKIKLPFSGKKTKRRKSMKALDEVNSHEQDEAEEMSPSFELNPQKRTKIDEAEQHAKTVLQIEDVSDKSKDVQEKCVEDNKMLENNKTEKEGSKKVTPNFQPIIAKDNEKIGTEIGIVEEAEADEEKSTCQTQNLKSSDEDNDTVDEIQNVTLIESSSSNELTRDDEKIVSAAEKCDGNGEGEGVKKKNLTTKQLKLMEQRRQAREEKERKLQEEKQLKQFEKEKREEAKKLEREQREEQRRKEREEKEEKRRMEREEKERKRQAEFAAKNEEKRKRHEAREEELREKEEERKRKDEEKNLKSKKAAEVFTKFFVPKTSATANKGEVQNNISDEEPNLSQSIKKTLAFRPFQVKGAMKLAPVSRRQLTKQERNKLDLIMQQNNSTDDHNDNDNINSLYLSELRLGKLTPIKWRKMTSNELKETSSDIGDDDVLIIEDEFSRAGQAIFEENHMKCLRAKYYRFHENRRPPYYGTWRKYSKIIKARRPFAQDVKTFDYEVDSDLEWEEEEPGELLEDSDDADDKDKESENDDYDVDNEWMVPHGHLSDEEMQHEDEFGEMCIEGVDNDNNTREAQKAKLKLLQQEFAMEMKKKTKKIQPRLVGCIWVDENGNQPSTCSNLIWQSIEMRSMLFTKSPMLQDINNNVEANELPKNQTHNIDGSMQDKAKPIILTDEMLKDLVRLVHGNSLSKQFLIKEFIAHIETNEATVCNGEFRGPLKSTVRKKIDKFAEWQAIEENNSDTQNDNNNTKDKDNNNTTTKSKKNKKRLCWVVNADVLSKMDLQNLSLQNEWHYLLCPRKPLKNNNNNNNTSNISNAKLTDEIESSSTTTNADTVGEETLNRNIEEEKSISLATISPRTGKKRVPLLMSVDRGQQIPTIAKNALISQFLKRNDERTVEKNKNDNNMENATTAQQQQQEQQLDNVVIID